MFGCSDDAARPQLPRDEGAAANHAELGRTDALDAEALARRYAIWRSDALEPQPVDGAAGGLWSSTTAPVPLGREHRIPSDAQTVVQGVLDPHRAPIATVDSGDVLIYENTWTHFLNRLQPGVSIAELVALRRAHPERGVHSVIGPVAVRGAQPGDVLQVDLGRHQQQPADRLRHDQHGRLPAGQHVVADADLVDFHPGTGVLHHAGVDPLVPAAGEDQPGLTGILGSRPLREGHP